MSSVTGFIRESLKQLHQSYDEGISDLTLDQLHWRATDTGAPIAFILWHYVRTEDNIIQFVLQQRPTIWIDGGWYDKFGLHRTAQGTGMSLEDAQNLRIESLDEWRSYQTAVWRATDAYLSSVDDTLLDNRITVKPLGEMPVRNAIGMMCLTHGFTHLGEVQHLRGLMGLKGMGW